MTNPSNRFRANFRTIVATLSSLAFAAIATAQVRPGEDALSARDETPTVPVLEESSELACALRFAATIQSHYDEVRDFSASFVQTTRSVMLGNTSLGSDAPSSGTVQFKKPGKMRWRYESPTPSEVISDGKILWIYDASTREVQRLPVTEGYLTGAALEFLLGDGKILEEFVVETSACAPDSDNAVDLKLLPKAPASYESLGLRANRDSGEILATSLMDLFGNETHISFRDVSTNLEPPTKTFTFEVPTGVQVIDLVTSP